MPDDDVDSVGNLIDLASRKSAEKSAWFAQLKTGAKGIVLATVSNAVIIFANDPELSGMLAYNEFTCRPVLLRSPPTTAGLTAAGPFPRSWEASDRTLFQAYFERIHNPKFSSHIIGNAMESVAVGRRFHPVRDYLRSLVWDGVDRIDYWLQKTFGTPDDAYHRAIGSRFLLAAVRRIMRPGCKYDTVLLLEGAQDIGKSRACRALFGDDWFTDTLPSDLRGRDAADALTGVWGIEFAEIEHLLRSEPEESKAFISRQIDRYYPRYSHAFVERPRQCVFVGTTNRDDYARDSSGNRRLWPAACQFAVVEWVMDNRDQLWAEAVADEPDAVLWLDDDVARAAASSEQAQRYQEDPWEEQVMAFLSGRYDASIPEILVSGVHVPIERCDKRSQMRVADILRSRGWRRNRGGALGRRWHAP